MPWTEFAALLVFATAMSFTPGPNTALSAALAANGGLRHALPFVLAVPVGWALLLLACVAGLGALVQAQPAVRGALKAAGLAYLLWLAWTLARSTRLAGPAAGSGGGALAVGFGHGVLLQFLNFKAWMNALLIGAGWVTVADPPWARLALVLPVVMAYGLASNLAYALVGAALRHWLAQGRRLLWFNRALALLLAGTALWMATL
jgi:threonine/homoserine/homoserine lactone efflux protein